ncbi:hypothetical protein Egran_04025 [Elaphomyces granulatus]|uniref:PUM-HD domain-containing protein n=1 Tax=Elaphomyces granulatus TaxID=519963 RepID=A0A232LVP5_9EURO|nr:hypothetical protein Egran_04025 [Elaphomyces granulatus]
MAGLKRRVESAEDHGGKRTKVKDGPNTPRKTTKDGILYRELKQKDDAKNRKKATKATKAKKKAVKGEDEFDIDEDSDISDDENPNMLSTSEHEDTGRISQIDKKAKTKQFSQATQQNNRHSDSKKSSSREMHAKQNAILQERKAAKPNADLIARSKKLWERLRRKSHVPREERKQLVAELYDIITGRVRDLVFKHDSVRVIQTALKYATLVQRRQIACELKGSYQALAESRYAKFLVGKMLVHGDAEIRDTIIPEFYGSVRRLIRHPEASWILDDIYRTVATKEQKLNLLQEWYGPEFAIFRDNNPKPATDLSQILAEHPEKRGPIMRNLYELINLLVQKKSTGFTMLHDAMLQYFLNTKPSSSEAIEFIELIKGDEEGDLAKNMAFTKPGSRLMCLCLAYSTAKDRKVLLRFYRDTIKMMAGDVHGHMVIIAALEVIDDTKLTSKAIFPELLNQGLTEDGRFEELLLQAIDLTARIPVLYLFAGDKVKWLLTDTDQEVLSEIREIRRSTSKKESSIRRQELIKAASPILLEFIAASAGSLMETSFGCQFITEVLFGAEGDKLPCLTAVANAAKSRPDVQDSIFVGRMLKALVQGGRFNNRDKVVEKVDPPLSFHSLLYETIKDDIMSWVVGSHPFVIVALVESDDFDKKGELLGVLKTGKKALKQAVSGVACNEEGKGRPTPASSGARLLLEKLR